MSLTEPRILDQVIAGTEMAQILLHGTLHATIYEIDKLKGGFGENILHKVNLMIK